MNFNEWMMQKREKRLEEIQKLKKELENYPEGSLIFQSRGKTNRWYLRKGKDIVYLPRNQRPLAEKLASKRYLEAKIKDAEEQIGAIEAYLHQYQAEGRKGRHLLMDRETKVLQSRGIRELMKLGEYAPDESLEKWQYEEYEHLVSFEEGKKIRLADGRKVRSKSEALIGNELLRRRIPFRYEAAIEIAGKKYYPDYTIRTSEMTDVLLWEHLGLMDEGKYRFDAAAKIRDYMVNGYFPGINLILTSETSEKPLDYVTVDQMIQSLVRKMDGK